jgi:hypothetical protein
MDSPKKSSGCLANRPNEEKLSVMHYFNCHAFTFNHLYEAPMISKDSAEYILLIPDTQNLKPF